jgi:glycosyltransferase involved in cell wall biosynthesis
MPDSSTSANLPVSDAPVRPEVSVIVPARNEEVNLATCLESLIGQADVSLEIIVVNDQSTDRTREIAESFSGVRVIEADPLHPGWTGKNNAVATGARAARGNWLLFTDADTVHLPGSLARALSEAQYHRVDMLSYSPEQIAVTFWEMAVLPVVFAELARQYPPSRVSNPRSKEAAANGQYILVKREAYETVGGHGTVASEILEDVALARAFKASGRRIRFRYAADAVRTRMYRNFRQLREGWTKNLALLFPTPGWLATRTLFFWALPWAVLLWPVAAFFGAFAKPQRMWIFVFCLAELRNVMQLQRSNFGVMKEFIGAVFGMPIFAYLLLLSKRAHTKGKVSWKGRSYEGQDRSRDTTLHNHPVAGRLS